MGIIEYAENTLSRKLSEPEKEILRAYEKLGPGVKAVIAKHYNTFRKLPHKCDFCEFDRGPYMDPTPQCISCHNLNNFQVKKRMHQRQAYEWELYKQLKGEKEG